MAMEDAKSRRGVCGLRSGPENIAKDEFSCSVGGGIVGDNGGGGCNNGGRDGCNGDGDGYRWEFRNLCGVVTN
ncbi:hypothetical protein L1987_33468 [Smallanthus sonchifolius]|uniref:Uncharacterized protein n=1 Tax=Smallanthus sonchifolius TaxID=185202 RepID=A0ACB9HR59_9ASTR|nr:hypothetical protein L1987_33468 [Smallanthus sonchifolius]